MPVATLTSKGQITVPASVRAQLGLKTGDQLDFVLAPDGSVTLKAKRTRFEELRGILRSARRRSISLQEMGEAIERTVGARWKRAAEARPK
ncbi:MAG: type II toxin-antitoxin system PrlF family antitoxin [Acidobacteriota bacterium]